MDKNSALSKFYENNRINLNSAFNIESSDFDDNIVGLESNLEKWLNNIQPEDREIFLDVFSKFTYFTQAHCMNHWVEVVELLKTEISILNIEISEVLFVVVESPRGTKSGAEDIIGDLYKRNRKNNITKENIVSSFDKFDLKVFNKIKAVVFLDDMIGSGITLSHTIQNVTSKFNSLGYKNIQYYCSCLTPTKRGVRLIIRNCKNSNTKIKMLIKKNWFVDHMFEKNSLEYTIFENYEKMIEKYFEDKPVKYFMGFQEARLGVAFYYNTPNNTLSSFWCETKENFPPFKRDGNQPRLSLEHLKATKKATDNNAYIVAELKRDDSY